MSYMKMLQGFHPIVYLLVLGSVLMNIGFGMVVPFFAIYIATYTELNPAWIGFVVGAAAIGGMLGGLLGGTLSDLIGRKVIIVSSLFVSSLIYLGFILNAYPWLLIFLTLLKGFFIAFYEPCAKAIIADLTEVKLRKRAFTLRYVGVNLGFAIGPIIGVLIGVTSQSTLPFFITFILLICYAIILHIKLSNNLTFNQTAANTPHKVSFKISMTAIRKDTVLLLFLVGGILATSVHGQFSVVLSQYFDLELPHALTYLMLLWSIHSIIIILLSLPITKIMERLSSFQAIVIGTLLFAIGIMGFGFSFTFWSLCISMIIFTVGEILLIPAEYAIIDEIAPEHLKGTYYGAFNFTTLGSFFGPGLAGILLMNFGGKLMFFTLFLLSIISIFFYYIGQRYYSKKRHRSNNEILSTSSSI